MIVDIYLSSDFEGKIRDKHPNRNGRNINFHHCVGDKHVEIDIQCDGGERLVCLDIELDELILAIEKLKLMRR